MPSTLLEQCVHEKLKSLPEETAGQVGYSSANVWKNVPQAGISKCHLLSCSFVTEWIFFFFLRGGTSASFAEQSHTSVTVGEFPILGLGLHWDCVTQGFWGRDRKQITDDGVVGVELRHLARIKLVSEWDSDPVGNIWWSLWILPTQHVPWLFSCHWMILPGSFSVVMLSQRAGLRMRFNPAQPVGR